MLEIMSRWNKRPYKSKDTVKIYKWLILYISIIIPIIQYLMEP
jgi:hypothetical protein